MELKPEIIERLKKLDEKYQAMGQDLISYLDGLLYADYLTYWDYINLDTLLTLQKPRTSFPDEKIFILYHQISELYFNLCIHELDQLAAEENITGDFLLHRVKRIVMYFDALTTSFEIMVTGMDQDQFLKFRMALLPASGFQSAQYRMIELSCTELVNLVDKELRENYRGKISEEDIEEMYRNIYWKRGATELATGQKTLTLKQFEEKYSEQFIERAKKFRYKNIAYIYKNLPEEDRKNPELIRELRQLDAHVNINWPLSHYKSAVRYLHKNPEDIAATGGTNWQKYLPPRFQRRNFFPDLWSEEEHTNWGKTWVKKEVFGEE